MLTAQPADYVGRTVDLLMFDDMRASGDTPVSQVLVQSGMSGALITGIEKLVQRFLLELFTEIGSMAYLPQRGCRFMLDARMGLWRTPDDVISSFYGSLLDVKRNLIDDERSTDPNDERFSAAVIDTVAVTKDRVVVHMTITSLAGTGRDIKFPLRVTYK